MNWIAPLFVASLALGQTTPVRVETRDEAMARLKNLKPDHVADQQKLAALAREFATETDRGRKSLVALNLVFLGEKNPIYFEFLESLAREALENVGPDPFLSGPEPAPTPQTPTPDFLRWSEARQLDPSVSMRRHGQYMSDFLLLAMCRDPRARPLLLKALTSESVSFARVAAQGLVSIGNPNDLDAIVGAARAWPQTQRQYIYRFLEHSVLSGEGTVRIEATLAALDPEGLTYFREQRRKMNELRQAEKAKK